MDSIRASVKASLGLAGIFGVRIANGALVVDDFSDAATGIALADMASRLWSDSGIDDLVTCRVKTGCIRANDGCELQSSYQFKANALSQPTNEP